MARRAMDGWTPSVAERPRESESANQPSPHEGLDRKFAKDFRRSGLPDCKGLADPGHDAGAGVGDHDMDEEHHARRHDERIARVDHRRDIHPCRPERAAERVAAGGVSFGAEARGIEHVAVDIVERPEPRAGPCRVLDPFKRLQGKTGRNDMNRSAG